MVKAALVRHHECELILVVDCGIFDVTLLVIVHMLLIMILMSASVSQAEMYISKLAVLLGFLGKLFVHSELCY